ncbi:MAG: hypothetical protein OEY81_00830 [Candidatus Bathyarchaeota archaeon]|nr:hypothetical protein [Candidatus Bathyarchaeota archaeon]
MVEKVEKDKVEAEPSLKDLKERLRKLQTEKADLLLQAKKLEKTARKRVRSLKKGNKSSTKEGKIPSRTILMIGDKKALFIILPRLEEKLYPWMRGCLT